MAIDTVMVQPVPHAKTDAGDRHQKPQTAHARNRRTARYSVNEINALKARDNWTNWRYLAMNWAIISGAIGLAIWGEAQVQAAGYSPFWLIPIAAVTIIIIGASQHQLGGAVHEATHFYLFKNRTLNEAASDWLAAFPIYTSTHHFRLHHLSHHQFVNDPERDPNFAQAEQSGHWLDFPLTHFEMAKGLLRLLWIPNLISYTLARARYSALGLGENPYGDPKRPGHWLTAAIGIAFAGLVPLVMSAMLLTGVSAPITLATLAALYAGGMAFYLTIPVSWYQGSRIEPVFSNRILFSTRLTFLAILYASLTAIDLTGYQKAWSYFALYWVLPLFTTFPVFMMLREWLQHGNADRGKMTNSRVFMTGPIFNYAVMPWGMDYHLPHHLMSSVPHYNLRKLHELLLRDPEYAEKGVIVEGLVGPADPHTGRPTALGVLHVDHAPKGQSAAHVDETVLVDANVSDPDGLARMSEESRKSGPQI